MCCKEIERRGIGINRMLHAAKLFCEYQNDTTTKSQNKTVLKKALFVELYEEIFRILPSLAYCLAPKKEHE